VASGQEYSLPEGRGGIWCVYRPPRGEGLEEVDLEPLPRGLGGRQPAPCGTEAGLSRKVAAGKGRCLLVERSRSLVGENVPVVSPPKPLIRPPPRFYPLDISCPPPGEVVT